MCLQVLHRTKVIKTKQKNTEMPYVQMTEKYMGNKRFANKAYPLLCILQVEFTTFLISYLNIKCLLLTPGVQVLSIFNSSRTCHRTISNLPQFLGNDWVQTLSGGSPFLVVKEK